MSFAWEGADRFSGGTGHLSETMTQELSEPVAQRILQVDDYTTKYAILGDTQHAPLFFWPDGDLTTTNVITAIMQASSPHMALPNRCRAARIAHWEARQLAWKTLAAHDLRLTLPAVAMLYWKLRAT